MPQPKGRWPKKSKHIDVEALVELASEILTERNQLQVSFAVPDRESALDEIIQVGTSAGGARAKAIIAWNYKTNEVRSGQLKADIGFTYWLLKFDGVSGNKDKELEDPEGFGLIEYAYYKMARETGIKHDGMPSFEREWSKPFHDKTF